MVIGALLGYVTASGRPDAIHAHSAIAAPAVGDAPSSRVEADHRQKCVSDGASKGQLLARADPKAIAAVAQGQNEGKKPNILVIFGDDIGQTNVSAYSMGLMGYRTPNIDRIAKEGMIFTDYYAVQLCSA
jgi:arylsulfatase